MRLDLFLKTSRLIKRRTMARNMCDEGRVLVNGVPAKPAKDVKRGDIITVKSSSRIIDLEVLDAPTESPRKISPAELYRIKAQSRPEKSKDLWDKDLS